jgi:hypothetical protein
MNRPLKPILLMLSKPIRIRLACHWQPVAFTPKLRFVTASPKSLSARLRLGRVRRHSVNFTQPGWRR